MENENNPEQQDPINHSRRSLTKSGLAAGVVVASLVTKNALACVPHNLTCSGKLSGNNSGHGPNGDDGCSNMGCNYSKEKHKSDCDNAGNSYHRRPVDRGWDSAGHCKSDWKYNTKLTWDDNHTTQGFAPGGNENQGYSRCFKDIFGTPGGKKYMCKQTSTGSGYWRTRKWDCVKNPSDTTNYDDCTLADLISWHCGDGRWNGGSDDDTTYAAKCSVLYLNAECDGDRINEFPLTRQHVKDIYACIVKKSDFYPDLGSSKCIKYADLKPWVDTICSLGHV
jgi:hypothetical protein